MAMMQVVEKKGTFSIIYDLLLGPKESQDVKQLKENVVIFMQIKITTVKQWNEKFTKHHN